MLTMRRLRCWWRGHLWAPEWTDPVMCAYCGQRGWEKT